MMICIGEHHADTVLGTKDDHGAGLDGLAGSQLKVVGSEDVAQNHEDLQHGVISADTASRSGTEGKEGERWAQLVVGFGEPIRIETLRILPVARSIMRPIDIHNDHRSAGYGEVAYAIVGDSHAVDHPKRRGEPERLHNYLSRKFEFGNVAVAQRRVTEYGVKFLPYLFEALGTRAQKIKKPR